MGRQFALGQRLRILDRLERDGSLTGAQLLQREPSLPRGTIYTTLRRLKDDGLVTLTKKHDRKQAGPPRGYYKVTPRGRRAVELGRVLSS